MNVSLTDGEIKQAIIEFIGNQGIAVTGKEITVVITGGKKQGDKPAEAKGS